MGVSFWFLCVCSLLPIFQCLPWHNKDGPYDETVAKAYLAYVNVQEAAFGNEYSIAEWGYESNITDENLEVALEVGARVAQHAKEQWVETNKFPWETFQDPDIVRQFSKLSVLGTAALSADKLDQLDRTISEMQGIYGKATVCDFHNKTKCDLFLEPEITERFVESRDPEELKWLWTAWRNATGQKVRPLYPVYVDLSNEAAVLNNFTDNSEYWISGYESDEFTEDVEKLWEQLRPLYLQLHAYVRRRLREQYGEDVVSKKGPIPAHLLGNVWAQTWENVLDLTIPYPNKPSVDVSQALIDQKYDAKKMFELAEEFYVSLNLSAMTPEFWERSIIERPADGRDLICHASAWDFYDTEDFRIKMCTTVSLEDLKTIHHEMGHIEYFMQYSHQPNIYRDGANPDLKTIHHEMGHIEYYMHYKHLHFVDRDGANPGFHEAIGDTMALSVSTPKHLRKINLLNTTTDDEESDINQLFLAALEKVAFLPFGYLIDLYRWSIFRGEVTPENYNCKWWELREKYQGVEPPVDRSEADFDAGAKFHIVADSQYIAYFVSFVVQFQFHKALCEEAGEFNGSDPNTDPLYKCDIYQSIEAGTLLKNMLSLGGSKPWPEAMEVITGQRKMDANALLEYFSTLQAWLEAENKRTGEYIGWEPTTKVCSSNSS